MASLVASFSVAVPALTERTCRAARQA